MLLYAMWEDWNTAVKVDLDQQYSLQRRSGERMELGNFIQISTSYFACGFQMRHSKRKQLKL
jgi:hypothetical protein